VRVQNVSQDVTKSFSSDMHINPIPRDRDGNLARNPFNLQVRDV
jgi:hypothetical protein